MYDGISEAVICELEILHGEINELTERVTKLERKLPARDRKPSVAKRQRQSARRKQ